MTSTRIKLDNLLKGSLFSLTTKRKIKIHFKQSTMSSYNKSFISISKLPMCKSLGGFKTIIKSNFF